MGSRKPIALFYSSLASSGGAEKMVCWLANELALKGYQVLLLSLDESDDECFYPLEQDVRWIKLGRLSRFHRTRLQVNLFKENGIRLLIAFVASGDRTLYLSAKITGTKIVIAERNAPSMYKIRFSYIQRVMSFLLMHLADRITVQQSEFVEGYPRTLRGRSRCISNPVKIPTYRSSPSKSIDDRYKILAVTRLDGVQKGVTHLISGFSKISQLHSSWDLIIVGKGPQYPELKRQVERLNLDSRVFFAGEKHDVSPYYLNSHLFVIPSLWEGFPNALVEAMSYGLPCIGFEDAMGVSDLISDDVGWLASGLSNSDSLASVMSIAMSKEKERVCKGRNARRKMLKYKPEKQILAWEKLIEGI